MPIGQAPTHGTPWGFPAGLAPSRSWLKELYPAAEIAALYHERWEIELGYDEVKTKMLDRQEAIRSRTPAGVGQELRSERRYPRAVKIKMSNYPRKRSAAK
ncbi:MAG TPA: hypothetical protein VLT47_03990, partial [Anaeromyxobacteraceae bacterium]|nr:hypothetical protein [Anaeromyxobacteraceae bacterium]